MLTYLRDDVDGWIAWYGSGKPEKKRWGKGEDKLMIKSEVYDLTAEDRAKEVILLEMHDALFRANSCVVLPEGEGPMAEGDEHLALSSVGMIATVLRYNEEHLDSEGNAEKKILIAGHCDTTNTVDFDQKLSEERAGVALAMLIGDRESFVKLCEDRNDEVDVTQVFDWTTRAYGFTCKPTRLDAKPSDERYRQFRESYNAWLDARNPEEEPDSRGGPKLAKQGRLDKTIWGAIFAPKSVYGSRSTSDVGSSSTARKKASACRPSRFHVPAVMHAEIDPLARVDVQYQKHLHPGVGGSPHHEEVERPDRVLRG